MLVQAIMSKSVPAVEAGTGIETLARLLDTTPSIAVVDPEWHPFGTVTRDAVRAAWAQARWHPSKGLRFTASSIRACDLPLDPPVTVGQDAPVAEAVEKLLRSGAYQVIVVDPAGRIVGAISREDLVDHRRQTRANRRKALPGRLF